MLLELLFPPKCPYCSCSLTYNMTECASCRNAFPPVPRIEYTPSGDICTAPFTYEGIVADALKDYKFRGNLFNAKSFSAAMVSALKAAGANITETDVITCVPMTKGRRKKRGFNQAEILAKKTAALLGKPFRNLLWRDVESVYQHYLEKEERKIQNKNYYSCISIDDVRGKKILLIDDIMTSGATLSSCCGVLKDNGAESVICAVTAIAKKQKGCV